MRDLSLKAEFCLMAIIAILCKVITIAVWTFFIGSSLAAVIICLVWC
jgi:hypothetical protein